MRVNRRKQALVKTASEVNEQVNTKANETGIFVLCTSQLTRDIQLFCRITPGSVCLPHFVLVFEFGHFFEASPRLASAITSVAQSESLTCVHGYPADCRHFTRI